MNGRLTEPPDGVAVRLPLAASSPHRRVSNKIARLCFWGRACTTYGRGSSRPTRLDRVGCRLISASAALSGGEQLVRIAGLHPLKPATDRSRRSDHRA